MSIYQRTDEGISKLTNEGNNGIYTTSVLPNNKSILSLSKFESYGYTVKVGDLLIDGINLFKVTEILDESSAYALLVGKFVDQSDLEALSDCINLLDTVESKDISCKFTDGPIFNLKYNKIVTCKIASYLTEDIISGQSYTFGTTPYPPKLSIYRRVALSSTSAFTLRISSTTGDITITPNSNIIKGTGLNFNETYITP